MSQHSCNFSSSESYVQTQIVQMERSGCYCLMKQMRPLKDLFSTAQVVCGIQCVEALLMNGEKERLELLADN